jgi:hypothetical protein
MKTASLLLCVPWVVVACGLETGGQEPSSASAVLALHAAAERVPARKAHLATGRLGAADSFEHPWPFPPLSIGHTNASYQNYDGDPYFHHGIDIRGDAGTTVLSAAAGKVVDINNYMPGDAYWEIAILDDAGFLWQYHHVEHSSIPQEVNAALQNGTVLPSGSKLGEVFYWPISTFGEQYHHIHVNVLGAGGEYLSPFRFLTPLPDHQAPVVIAIGLLKDGQPWSGGSVSAPYGAYAQVHDLIMHQQFVVPPHSLSIRVDGGPAAMVWQFDQLPGGSDISAHVNDFFVPELSCGDYECRKLTINLDFRLQGESRLPTTPGPHHLEILAKDFVGNQGTGELNWTVQ